MSNQRSEILALHTLKMHNCDITQSLSNQPGNCLSDHQAISGTWS